MHPTYTWMGKDDVPKSVSALTTEEKILFDRENKAMASISILDVKKSQKELLKKQFLVFKHFQNESLDDLATRFYHLLSELSSASMVYETEEINDKFLEALPSKFDVYMFLIKENVKYKTMSLEVVLGKIQSHDLNMKKKETNMEHIQDPSMYFAKSSGKTGAGVAFFSGDTDVSHHHCSGVSSHTCFSANTTSSSSRTHNMNQRVADDYLAMFSSFMASYENFIGGKIHDPDVIEEDFRQIDLVDLEEMNIQWNMAMLMRQAKDFLKKTGRKYIRSNSCSRMGFDKTKVRCYNCQEYGHFAKECVKPKVEFDSQKKPNNFQNNRNQSHGSSGSKNSNHASASSALVAQNDDNYDWVFILKIWLVRSSDGESLPSAAEDRDQVQNGENDIASGVSEDDIVLTQNSSNGADSENIPIAKVFMADMSDPSKIEKQNEIVAQKNKEISDKESEVIKLHRKLENFENSSVVFVDALSCDNTLDGEKAPAYLASTQEVPCVLAKYARTFGPAHLLSAQASGHRKRLVRVAEKNLGNLLNYDNEIDTPQKPPKLLNVNDYSNWKARFEHYISYTDSSLWIPILERYKHPTHIYLDDELPKPISKLSDEEKKAYDREKKALGSITMALTRELFRSFRGYDNSKDLCKALQKRFEGNSDIKKSKRDLLRKQYECFRFFENESLDDLISRFYHLQTELNAFDLKYPDEEMVEKFLDALPPKFEMYTTLMRENPKFYELTVEEAIGKIQAHEMNLKRKENS
ncbi:hypothetical protein L1987_45745 [Smallanthus sonchifolius]|uniref:Uncharacterized protein n=1 Tax=Smallanthus sonchifolius TaxID=185202 RepID=A0ACB9FYU5_9ASTR|nr:hypothetical protein L1987_45745 [Smallanthus sonchifolius]